MIIIAGASLSEQHTDLLICHRTKQDSSRTSRYLGITYDKPTARTATVNVAQARPRGLHMHELSFIIIAGASLSEQHTDLLICHCTKQDSSRTSIDI